MYLVTIFINVIKKCPKKCPVQREPTTSWKMENRELQHKNKSKNRFFK